MSDLEVLLNRIRKEQAEREEQAEQVKNIGSTKDKWQERGVSHGLEWVENEILNMLANKSK